MAVLFYFHPESGERGVSQWQFGGGWGRQRGFSATGGAVASRHQTSAAVREAPGQDRGHVAGMFNTSELCKQCPQLVNVLGSAHTCLPRPSPHGPVKVGMLACTALDSWQRHAKCARGHFLQTTTESWRKCKIFLLLSNYSWKKFPI